ILAFAGLATLVGCQKDDLNGGYAEPGSNINFNCGLDEAQSRAQYAANDWRQIEWKLNDPIKIYSNETTNKDGQLKSVGSYYVNNLVSNTYQITIDGETKDITNNSKANLGITDGLYWGTGQHTFYATFGDATVNLSNGKATFNFKKDQQCTLSVGEGEQTYIDRSQLNLVAKTTTGLVKNVDLHFRPIMTTVEIEVKGPASGDPIEVTSVAIMNQVTSTHWFGSNTDGTYKFVYDINNPSAAAISGTAINNELVTLSLNDGQKPSVTLAANQILRVTAILPPVNIAANQLKIMVNSNAGITKSAKLPNAITLSAKAIVTLPTFVANNTGGVIDENVLEDLEKNVNKWMSYLPDNAYVASVTMPGTHISAATQNVGINWNYILSGQDNTALIQPYSVKAQLAQGVRVLDFYPAGVNKDIGEAIGERGHEAYNHILYAPAWDDRTASSGTRDNLKDMLCQWVKDNPTEFLIVFMRPMCAGRDTNRDQTINVLNTVIAKWKNQGVLKIFEPNMTVSECRGKIVLFLMNEIHGKKIYGLWDVDVYMTPSDFCFIGDKYGSVGEETAFCTGAQVNPNLTNPWEGQGNYTAKIMTSAKASKNTNLHIQMYTGAPVADYEANKPGHINANLTSSKDNTSNTDWYLNVVGGYEGTTINTKAHRDATKNVQANVVGYIQDKWDNNAAGPLGMVLVDFSGSDTETDTQGGVSVLNGLKLVQMLIDNNFKDNVLRLK
ncbi:MAG: hypothetical protein HUJ98_10925, partial [Bacteroidaceae bacterium]|nr:hypothetical protein [Bacteroidaceae bacterium]